MITLLKSDSSEPGGWAPRACMAWAQGARLCQVMTEVRDRRLRKVDLRTQQHGSLHASLG